MTLEEIRLLLDFGLVVLIWLVQLIIYPSFKYISSDTLHNWHDKYSTRISIIVIPLMLGQLGCALMQLGTGDFLVIVNDLLVASLWVLTFTIFVPMHRRISQNKADHFLLNKLAKLNWWRTVLWSLVFLLSLLGYFCN